MKVVYNSMACGPTMPPLDRSSDWAFALTAERRRRVCLHEAAHAVIFALAGATVCAVAVADVGSLELDYTSRRGVRYKGWLGVNDIADPDVPPLMLRWGGMSYDSCDETRYRACLQGMTPAGRAAHYRRLRGRVCGLMAGPVAEEIIDGPGSDDPSDEV